MTLNAKCALTQLSMDDMAADREIPHFEKTTETVQLLIPMFIQKYWISS